MDNIPIAASPIVMCNLRFPIVCFSSGLFTGGLAAYDPAGARARLQPERDGRVRMQRMAGMVMS
jgi:hypothetical protein